MCRDMFAQKKTNCTALLSCSNTDSHFFRSTPHSHPSAFPGNHHSAKLPLKVPQNSIYSCALLPTTADPFSRTLFLVLRPQSGNGLEHESGSEPQFTITKTLRILCFPPLFKLFSTENDFGCYNSSISDRQYLFAIQTICKTVTLGGRFLPNKKKKKDAKQANISFQNEAN